MYSNYKGVDYYFERGCYKIKDYPALYLSTQKAVKNVIETLVKSKI